MKQMYIYIYIYIFIHIRVHETTYSLGHDMLTEAMHTCGLTPKP